MAESDPSETGLKALRLKAPRGHATRGLWQAWAMQEEGAGSHGE